MFSSRSKFFTQANYAAAFARALYSASVEEREIDFWRDDRQEIMFDPR